MLKMACRLCPTVGRTVSITSGKKLKIFKLYFGWFEKMVLTPIASYLATGQDLGSGDYNFHSSGNNYLHNGHASTAYAGTLRENGSLITDPQSTPLPQSLSVISLTSDSDLNASNFSNDRNINGRTWKGDLAELLIYNQPLENEKIEEVEGYLAHKWGLVESLDSSHRYKNQVPQFGLGDVFTYADHKQIEPFSFSTTLPPAISKNL